MSWLKEAKERMEYIALEGIDLHRVPKAVRMERMSICKGCDSYRHSVKQCGQCGCFMPIKTALEFDPVKGIEAMKKTKTVCPLGKW